MNRVCVKKATGKLIEMQGGGDVARLQFTEWSRSINNPKDRTETAYNKYLAYCDALETMRLNTLKQNAINAGYIEDQIEVKWVTDEELEEILEANKPVPTIAQLRAAEYPTVQECIEAMIEKYEENRPEKMAAIQTKRMAVKEKYPKAMT